MGATPIMELRKGDAAEDIDGDFEAWQSDLFEKLQSLYLCLLITYKSYPFNVQTIAVVLHFACISFCFYLYAHFLRIYNNTSSSVRGL